MDPAILSAVSASRSTLIGAASNFATSWHTLRGPLPTQLATRQKAVMQQASSREPEMSELGRRSRLMGAIFDVDGVLVASPHERAWREALAGFADPARFTTEFYQAYVAGKPRMDGARAALEGLGVCDAAGRTPDMRGRNRR